MRERIRSIIDGAENGLLSGGNVVSAIASAIYSSISTTKTRIGTRNLVLFCEVGRFMSCSKVDWGVIGWIFSAIAH